MMWHHNPSRHRYYVALVLTRSVVSRSHWWWCGSDLAGSDVTASETEMSGYACVALLNDKFDDIVGGMTHWRDERTAYSDWVTSSTSVKLFVLCNQVNRNQLRQPHPVWPALFWWHIPNFRGVWLGFFPCSVNPAWHGWSCTLRLPRGPVVARYTCHTHQPNI